MGERAYFPILPALLSLASASQWPSPTSSQRLREPVGAAQMGQPQGREQSGEEQREDVTHLHPALAPTGNYWTG